MSLIEKKIRMRKKMKLLLQLAWQLDKSWLNKLLVVRPPAALTMSTSKPQPAAALLIAT